MAKFRMIGVCALATGMMVAGSASADFNSYNPKFKNWCYEFKDLTYVNLGKRALLPKHEMLNEFEGQCKKRFKKPQFQIKSGRDHKFWIGPEQACEVSVQCEEADNGNVFHSLGIVLDTNKSMTLKMYCPTKDTCRRK